MSAAAASVAENSEPRVLVADDQALVRTGFRMILREAGIPVIGEAATGSEAVAAVLRHRPDVVLMDIRMPEMDRLEATRRILAARPESGCRIIMLTTFDLDQYVYDALAAGASGFLLKHVSPEYLVAAVRLVRSGDALLAPVPPKPKGSPLRVLGRRSTSARRRRIHEQRAGAPGCAPAASAPSGYLIGGTGRLSASSLRDAEATA